MRRHRDGFDIMGDVIYRGLIQGFILGAPDLEIALKNSKKPRNAPVKPPPEEVPLPTYSSGHRRAGHSERVQKLKEIARRMREQGMRYRQIAEAMNLRVGRVSQLLNED
jgi:hypothetical protein